VSILQSTGYPHSEEVQFRLNVPHPVHFALRLRIPDWVRGPATVRVNGRVCDVAAEPKTFATLDRQWKNNDVVDLRLRFTERSEPVDDRHPDTVARMNGPLMMVAVDPPAGQIQLGSPGLRMEPFYKVKSQTYTTYFSNRKILPG